MSDAPRRDQVIADDDLRGSDFAAAYSRLVDEWLAEAFAAALASAGRTPEGVALMATGGQGRAELSPASDLDLMVIHDGTLDPEAVAPLWYTVWDEGLKLGHSVRTIGEALKLAGQDLPTATALLSSRVVAGDHHIGADMARRAHEEWRAGARRRVGELADSVSERHASTPDVAFALEPDLKEGRGGLSDVHALRWLRDADPTAVDDEDLVAIAGRLRDPSRGAHRAPSLDGAIGRSTAAAGTGRRGDSARSPGFRRVDGGNRGGGAGDHVGGR